MTHNRNEVLSVKQQSTVLTKAELKDRRMFSTLYTYEGRREDRYVIEDNVWVIKALANTYILVDRNWKYILLDRGGVICF